MKYNTKKYTEDMVLEIIKDGTEKSLYEIRIVMGCSKSTVENILYDLLRAGQVKRRNVMSEKKPLWMYSVTTTSIEIRGIKRVLRAAALRG